MILGIDHIAYNSNKPNFKDIEKKLELNNRLFESVELPNSAVKGPLLNMYTARHNISLYGNHSSLPIEITFHGTHSKNLTSRVSVLGKELNITSDKKTAEIHFWSNCIGCQLEEPILTFTSILPKWSFKVNIIETDKTKFDMLDDIGFTCIALITNNLKEDLNKFVNFNLPFISDIFTHTVNGKSMSIAMVRSPTGVIIELIEIHRK